jgi:MFS transporter, ACS family, DAL5 transporter family protein
MRLYRVYAHRSQFYFGYFAWTYPTSILIARVPVAKYLTVNALFWGTVVAVTAACTNFGGLLAVRFLLGIAEATLTPAFMFLTSTWYTRDEIPFRTGIWFAGNSVGGLVASLMAFGVGHISPENAVGPWRAMYIILGLGTFVWAFAIFTFLPDRISNARFLNAEERQFAADRVVVAGTGSTEKTHWRLDQVKECLIDPKTWLIFALELATQIPNGGTQNFANLIIRSFGFTSLQSTLINIPYSLLAASVIAGTGWLAGRYRKMNCLLIVCVVTPCIVGSAMIYNREKISPSGVHLFAYFLLASGPGAMPLNLSLVQSNYRGVTKKMTVSAMVFVAYCAGNIAGPHFFRASEAPHYNTAFQTIMICYALVVVLALTLRTYLAWQNRKRAAEEGFEGSAGGSGAIAGGKIGAEDNSRDVANMVDQVELRPEDYDDVTDWKTVGFRYRY